MAVYRGSRSFRLFPGGPNVPPRTASAEGVLAERAVHLPAPAFFKGPPAAGHPQDFDQTEPLLIIGNSLAEAVETPRSGPQPEDGFDDADELEETAEQTRQLGAGDEEAFKHLFDTYFDRLYRYAFRYLQSADDSADVVHDVFLQIWRQRRRIGLERDLRSYLYATARNHALDGLKHRRVEQRFRERRAAALAAGESVGSAPDPESELEARELAAAIQKAIDSLPRRQREVLQLRWQGPLSYDEVANLLGISPKTVGVHLSRAFEHLRRSLPDFLK